MKQIYLFFIFFFLTISSAMAIDEDVIAAFDELTADQAEYIGIVTTFIITASIAFVAFAWIKKFTSKIK